MPGLQSSPVLSTENRRYPAPVSAQRALSVVEKLALTTDSHVLDVACGRGGLLLDAVALHGCRGLGLTADARALADARESAARERVDGRTEFRLGSTADFLAERRYDAILCAGAPEHFTTVDETAARCLGWLRVGGVLVLGAPFLRRTPAHGYRGVLGEAAEHLRPTGVYARSVVGSGFELLVTAVCSECEWDAYESASYRAHLRYAAEHPDDPGAAAIRERAEAWYQAYWKYGRDTLGYAFHLFRRPRLALQAVPTG
jgi:cyclopropane fatty-acyl-phospholipid synthase-like methyltransferase